MISIVFGDALLPDGWARQVRVTFEDGVIVSIQPDVASSEEERFGIGIPGLPNLHSHAFQRGMAGLSEVRGPVADDFWTWREVMYRFLDRMTAEDMEAVAAQAYAEMLEGGFTRVGEFHYLHHQPDGTVYADPAEMATRIAAAAETAGIGLTLLPCFYARGGFGGTGPIPGQRRFLCHLDAFARLLDASRQAIAGLAGAVIGVAPHSLRAVTPPELAAVVSMAPDGPIHIHAAEQIREVQACLEWSGQRPVEWLLDHADLDARWCVIHATHMAPPETARLAASGAVAGLCPVTEANLGDGIFDGPGWLKAAGRFGIGTDSNVLIDAAAELRQLEYSQRPAQRARNMFAGDPGHSTGRSLFDAALAGGAQALGIGAGGLRPGAPADMVALDVNHPALASRDGDQWLDAWIFAAARPAVEAVWVRGRRVVADGRHVARTRIDRAFRLALQRLLAA
jgi:formimidoylglutamate deiminase